MTTTTIRKEVIMNYMTTRYTDQNYKTANTFDESLDMRPYQDTTRGAKVFAELKKETFIQNILNRMRKTEGK